MHCTDSNLNLTVSSTLVYCLCILLNIHLNEVLSGNLHIFATVQKVNIALRNFNSIKNSRLFKDSEICHFKMTGRSCTDEVRVKVPLFQKVARFTVI